jgi:signal transduction histidine kinase
VQIAPVGDNAAHPTHIICTYTDLTDLWETNDTLTREKEQLEQDISKRTEELQEFIDEMRTELKERRILEAELRLAEQRYRSLAKNFPNGVVVLFASNLDCILCEGELSERLRFYLAPSGGMRIEPATMNILNPSIYAAFEGKSNSFEVELDGQPFLAHTVPMYVEQSRVDTVMLVLQDISDFKARQELEQEREITELKYRFVTIASHELRTPLAGMMISSGILRRYWDTTSEEEKRESVQDIIAGLDRMSKLVDDILFVGKSEAGKLPFAPQILDLTALCGEYMNECMKGIGLQHITVSELPSTPLRIYADKKLTQLIVNNLLTNAYKYSPAGSEVHISLRPETVGDVECAVLTVRDKGIGIPAEDIPNLFKSFHRGANVGEIQGTGLGLAMVERAVEQHGGTIQVQSVEKEGTTFVVKLPIGKEAHSLRNET